jgi:hypothetical protein
MYVGESLKEISAAKISATKRNLRTKILEPENLNINLPHS